MTLLPHTSSPSVHIRSGVGMAVSLTGLRVHEPLALPDCTVSLQMLKFALDNAPEGFTATATDKHLEITAPGFSAKVPVVVEESLPEPEIHQKFIELDFTAIRRLSACCSPKEPGREILECVKLHGGKAASSNGRIFVLETGFPDIDLEIHRSHLAAIGDGVHSVSASEKSVCVTTDKGTMWLPRFAASFNIVEACSRLLVISGPNAAVKTSDVSEALKTAAQIVEKVEVLFLDDGIQIHTPNFSKRITAKPTATARICLNPKYLLACLSAVGDEFVDLFVSDSISMGIKGQKAQAVCMGIRG